jgi:hypothetical protein
MESEPKLRIVVLTRFLCANRYPPTDQVRGHASLENAIAHPLPTVCTTRTVAYAGARSSQGTLMTDREKILVALREKPLKTFEIMKRVNIKHEDDCQSLLLKMRDEGAVKFDIHKGHWRPA